MRFCEWYYVARSSPIPTDLHDVFSVQDMYNAWERVRSVTLHFLQFTQLSIWYFRVWPASPVKPPDGTWKTYKGGADVNFTKGCRDKDHQR